MKKSFRIIAFAVSLSLSAVSQQLPDAPQPKAQPKPTPQSFTLVSTVKKHKKAFVFSGVAAAGITATALALTRSSGSKPFVACACPAQVPKR